MTIEALNRRLFELAALLGDLHLNRRAPAERVAAIDTLIASTAAEIDALVKLRASLPPPPPSYPTMPDVEERPAQEGGSDVAPSAPVDPASDRPAP